MMMSIGFATSSSLLCIGQENDKAKTPALALAQASSLPTLAQASSA